MLGLYHSKRKPGRPSEHAVPVCRQSSPPHAQGEPRRSGPVCRPPAMFQAAARRSSSSTLWPRSFGTSARTVMGLGRRSSRSSSAACASPTYRGRFSALPCFEALFGGQSSCCLSLSQFLSVPSCGLALNNALLWQSSLVVFWHSQPPSKRLGLAAACRPLRDRTASARKSWQVLLQH